MSLDIDTSELIRDMSQHTEIWNRTSVTSKTATDQIWTALSKKFNAEVAKLKAKWKGLRDMFRVELKRIPRDDAGEYEVDPAEYKSRWVHYQSLLFLVDHMRTRDPKESTMQRITTMKREASQSIETLDAPEASTSGTQSTVTKRKMPDLLQHALTRQKRRNFSTSTHTNDSSASAESNDLFVQRSLNDDYHFLLSLQPYLAELDYFKKMRVRIEIEELLWRTLTNNPKTD